MDDLSKRVQAFLDAYAGDAPTPESVVEIVGDLESDRRRLRERWEALRDCAREINATRSHFEGCEASHTWCWIEKQCNEALSGSAEASQK